MDRFDDDDDSTSSSSATTSLSCVSSDFSLDPVSPPRAARRSRKRPLRYQDEQPSSAATILATACEDDLVQCALLRLAQRVSEVHALVPRSPSFPDQQSYVACQMHHGLPLLLAAVRRYLTDPSGRLDTNQLVSLLPPDIVRKLRVTNPRPDCHALFCACMREYLLTAAPAHRDVVDVLVKLVDSRTFMDKRIVDFALPRRRTVPLWPAYYF